MERDQGKWISTLTQNQKNVYYRKDRDGYLISWANMKEFGLTNAQISKILNSYFAMPGHWYPLGASEDDPILGGFGAFLKDTFKGFTPRHASAIAPVLVDLGYLEFRGKKPVYLRKISI